MRTDFFIAVIARVFGSRGKQRGCHPLPLRVGQNSAAGRAGLAHRHASPDPGCRSGTWRANSRLSTADGVGCGASHGAFPPQGGPVAGSARPMVAAPGRRHFLARRVMFLPPHSLQAVPLPHSVLHAPRHATVGGGCSERDGWCASRTPPVVACVAHAGRRLAERHEDTTSFAVARGAPRANGRVLGGATLCDRARAPVPWPREACDPLPPQGR